MTTNFTSKLVKIGAGNYRLDIETHCPDDTPGTGDFCPSFNIRKTLLGWESNGHPALLQPFHENTLGAARTYIEYQIMKLLNVKLPGCGDASFHRNSSWFLVWETTYTARNGMKYQVYIQRAPQITANYTARAFLPAGGELQADGEFGPETACCRLVDAIEAFHQAQADALDKIAPTTPVEAPASVDVDLSWLADDAAPRTDGLYGEYQAALSELERFRSDLSVEGEKLWLNAFQRSIDLRQQIVAQESRVVA